MLILYNYSKMRVTKVSKMIKNVGKDDTPNPLHEHPPTPEQFTNVEGRRYSTGNQNQKTALPSLVSPVFENKKITQVVTPLSPISEKKHYLRKILADPSKFQDIPLSLQNDKTFILSALGQCGALLEFLSEELKNDRTLVLAAVQNDGMALRFGSPSLQVDKDVILAAVTNTGTALLLVADKFLNDKQVISHALQSPGMGYAFVGEEILKDREIALLLVGVCGAKLIYLSEEFQRDKEIVLTAVANDGTSLIFAAELQGDEECVLTAVQNNPEAIAYADERLQKSRKIILACGGVKGCLNRLSQLTQDEQKSMLKEIEELQLPFFKELTNTLHQQEKISRLPLKNAHFHFQ